MDGQLSNDDIKSYEFIPSTSDPILPISHSLPQFNTLNSNYQHHHRSNYHELVDDFFHLQLSPLSLSSFYPSSIPSFSSFHPLPQLYPQERNSLSSRPFSIICTFYGHQFLLDSNSYSMRQQRWDSKFLMPPKSPINEMHGSIVSIANKLAGCNFLKDCLSKRRPNDITIIFSIILSDTAVVMVDLHGSSLFQKLLKVCNHRQWLELFNAIITNIDTLLNICCNDYSATTMRMLVDYCHTQEEISSLMHTLGLYLYFLAKHDHENRIVKWCLHYYDQLEKDILDPLLKNWEDLAKHKFICFILQQALTSSQGRIEIMC